MTNTDEARAADWLLGAGAVRAQCHGVLAAGEAGALDHFTLAPEKLGACARFVAETIQQNYPSGAVPYHSRWRHFVVDGEDRFARLALPGDGLERARCRIDLAVISVLLDAGAGEQWRYRDATGKTLSRSEGLAIASLEAFAGGLFSSDPDQPLRADAAALAGLNAASLGAAFQVSQDNPLVGLEGRAALMNRLGAALAGQRPGNLADLFMARAPEGALEATDILRAVLEKFGTIWPGRLSLGGHNLGDCWQHRAAQAGPAGAKGLVPFHKLSQWLSYSLVEPMQELGLTVTGLNALTGLAEYRNGGLLLDMGVIVPKHGAVTAKAHEPASGVIIEWRALTVALLDQLADEVRASLAVSAEQMPLASVLEGGTWAAGRRIAAHLRADGAPPIRIVSDGSVF